MKTRTADIAVIGGGAAGLTAAARCAVDIYSVRFYIKCLYALIKHNRIV